MASRLRKKAEGWGGRIRFGENLGRDEWIALDVPHDQEPQAKDRLARLQAMAKRLSEVGKHAEARVILEEAGATRAERGFRALEAMVEALSPEPAARKKVVTFRSVVQDLCDGTLHELHPDDIRYRTEQGRNARRTQLACFFPVLGDKTFDAITRDDVDEAKRLIPKGIKQNVRMRYCRELSYVMRIALEPLRLCEHVPHVSVPKQTDTDQFQLFYPDEDEQLLAAVGITFEERFLYAWLDRHGGRISEVLQYTWEALDLERGKIRVAKAWTKTKKARYWDLEPDVLEALRLRRLQIPDAVLVFVPPAGKAFTRMTVYHQLHPNLKAAGLTRPELYETPEGERPFTTHDFRASFVTLARALGFPDRWIMDRSGHESVKVLEKYDRGVRHARKQGLHWWAPMAIALGMKGASELSTAGHDASHDSGQARANVVQMPSKTPLLTNRCDLPWDDSHPVNPAQAVTYTPSIPPEGPLGPAGFSTSGQRAAGAETAGAGGSTAAGAPILHASDSPVEQALAAALPETAEDAALRALVFAVEEATKVQRWDVVLACTAELARRQLHRTAPAVSSLDAARRKRDGEGSK